MSAFPRHPLRFPLLLAVAASVSIASPAKAAEPETLDRVIVTGGHASGRTDLTASAPVTVLTAEQLEGTGYADLGRALEALEPTVNFPRAATTASSANTRAITLRGMSPDQTLVLVNGKRWHASAVLNFNNAVGRGTAPYDVATIPVIAIARVEILRDGAAAQYGSDAIAGVVNIILRSTREGGEARWGAGVTDRGDGFNSDLAAIAGFALPGDGHLTFSGQATFQQATNRAGTDFQLTPPRKTFEVGDPRSDGYAFAVDGAASMTPQAEVYGTALVARRNSTSAAQFRNRGTSPLYPGGFVPHVRVVIDDDNLIAGVRGDLRPGLRYDLSNTFGYSRARFTAQDTAVAALGAASPTRFDGGALASGQDMTNLTLTKDLESLLAGGSVAVGVEHRYESYRIGRGEPASYSVGGAQGFPGLNPRIDVDNGRTAWSAFVDAEAKANRWLSLSLAGRYDHYSDFGDAFTVKASGRAELATGAAVRASAGTGFRAPSLQQEYFSSVTSNSSNGALVNVGTFQVRDPVARSLGASDLEAERSRNYSIGTVLTPLRQLALTADVYKIDVDHRIVLSDQLSGSAVNGVLAAAGIPNVQQAQFFTNGADSTTRGYELTANYRDSVGDATRVETTLGYGRFATRLRRVASNPVLPSLPLFGQRPLLLLSKGQPVSKLVATLSVARGPDTALINVTHFGRYSGQPATLVQTFSAKTVTDLSLRHAFTRSVDLTAGVLNVDDVHPDQLTDPAAVSTGLIYGEESPFGVDGRAWYARLRVRF